MAKPKATVLLLVVDAVGAGDPGLPPRPLSGQAEAPNSRAWDWAGSWLLGTAAAWAATAGRPAPCGSPGLRLGGFRHRAPGDGGHRRPEHLRALP